MAESHGWIFVNTVPLLFEKTRVAKQTKVETWLDLAQLVRELGISQPNQTNRATSSTMGYVV